MLLRIEPLQDDLKITSSNRRLSAPLNEACNAFRGKVVQVKLFRFFAKVDFWRARASFFKSSQFCREKLQAKERKR